MARVLRWRRRVKRERLVQLADDPRDTPIYSVAEAAAYVGVPRSTLRHWLKPPAGQRAIIEAADPYTPQLSFYNLLEAHVLRIALNRKTWLRRVREAVERLREQHPTAQHPLLEKDLFTSTGYRSLFAKTLTGSVENLSFHGQLEFKQFFRNHLSRIDWDETGAYQLRPHRFQHVTINHKVSGGRPTVKGTGILVTILASRHRAGESVRDLADDYGISDSDVRDAIRYSAA